MSVTTAEAMIANATSALASPSDGPSEAQSVTQLAIGYNWLAQALYREGKVRAAATQAARAAGLHGRCCLQHYWVIQYFGGAAGSITTTPQG